MLTWLGWLIFITGLSGTAWLRRRKRRLRETRCAKCGYSREGAFERCPECGTLESEQARRWKRKLRWRYKLLAFAVVLVAYTVPLVPFLRAGGLSGFAPTALLVYLESDAHERWVVDDDEAWSFGSVEGAWWQLELRRRLYGESVPRWQLRWLAERSMALFERDDVSFKEWYHECGHIIVWVQMAGALDENVFLELAREQMLECRGWWVRGDEPKAVLRYQDLLMGESKRVLEIEVVGRETTEREIPLWWWLGWAVWDGVLLDLPEPAEDGYTIRYRVRDDDSVGSKIYMEGEWAVLCRFVDGWDEPSMPADRGVLQTAEEWLNTCGIRVNGTVNSDGSWTLDGRITCMVVRPTELEFVGVGVRAAIVVNGEEFHSQRLTLETDPFGFRVLTTWGNAGRPGHTTKRIRVDITRGDTVELVITPDKEMALRDLTATSYWEGKVVVPITEWVPRGSFWVDWP